MFGGLLGAAILGNLDGDMGLAGWRWLFIVVRITPSPLPFSGDSRLTDFLSRSPGRSNYDRYRLNSHMLFARLPRHDAMAHGRGETLCSVAAPSRC